MITEHELIHGAKCPYTETGIDGEPTTHCMPYWMGTCGGHSFEMEACHKYQVLEERGKLWNRLTRWIRVHLKGRSEET